MHYTTTEILEKLRREGRDIQRLQERKCTIRAIKNAALSDVIGISWSYYACIGVVLLGALIWSFVFRTVANHFFLFWLPMATAFATTWLLVVFSMLCNGDYVKIHAYNLAAKVLIGTYNEKPIKLAYDDVLLIETSFFHAALTRYLDFLPKPEPYIGPDASLKELI